jgi:hypothetical protein
VAQPQAILRAIQEVVTEGQLAYAGRSPDGSYHPIYFEEVVPTLELDFSDDWVLLKPEVARRHTQPAHLERLEVQPPKISVEPKTPISFSVLGYDQHGAIYPIVDPKWTASGGSIDDTGKFIAEDPGFYTITAHEDGRTASAHVQVAIGMTAFAEAGGLAWSGSIPPQKWTQFYMRILTKLVGRPGLELHVDLRLPNDADVSEALRKDVELALRELGLDDEVLDA